MDDNILPQISGDLIAQALNDLPEAHITLDGEAYCSAVDPYLGPVRLVCRKHRFKRGKCVGVFWGAVLAVRQH